MTSIESKSEENQMSFAEAFLDSLNWGEVTTGVPLENFLQFIKDSPLEEEYMISRSLRRKTLEFRIPATRRHGAVINQVALVTDADSPERISNETVYTPKTYMAWVTRTLRQDGSYRYNIHVDTILRRGLDSLQSSLKGTEIPLIPNITPIRQSEEETELKPIEIALQTAFTAMPKAS